MLASGTSQNGFEERWAWQSLIQGVHEKIVFFLQVFGRLSLLASSNGLLKLVVQQNCKSITQIELGEVWVAVVVWNNFSRTPCKKDTTVKGIGVQDVYKTRRWKKMEIKWSRSTVRVKARRNMFYSTWTNTNCVKSCERSLTSRLF